MKTYGKTHDEYVKSIQERGDEAFWNGYKHYSPLVEGNLDKLLQVDGFIELFHGAEFKVQMTILQTISTGYCVHSAYVWLRLFLELNISYKDLILESSCSEPSAEFFKGVEIDSDSARYFYQFLARLKDKIWSSTTAIQYSRQIMIMLMLTIPKDTLYKVVYRWIQDKASGGISDFARVAENWESVKDLPLDWAIQTVGTAHNCECIKKNRVSRALRTADL